MKPPARRGDRGPDAVELIEEAVHLLRCTPPGTLALYYAGTAPFALATVFYWAHLTWFHPAKAEVAWYALGLVGFFALMKTAQAEFCARLLAQRLGDTPPAASPARWSRLALSQLALQAWGVVVLPLALVATVPFPWVYAYFQNASVLGATPTLARDARAQAKLWPAQNVLGQLLLSGVGVAVWLNVALAFWLVPWLANRLLGLDNLFGFHGWWIANTTFLAATAGLSWLACDPLVKAFFTLRVFYGRARTTGEDLRIELTRTKRPRRAAVLVLAALAGLGLLPPHSRAAAPVAARAVESPELNAAILRVLERGEFQWRLRPLPQPERPAAEEGAIARFIRRGAEWVRDFLRWLGRLARELIDWIAGFFRDKSAPEAAALAGRSLAATLEIVMWVFVVAVAGLLLGVIAIAWRRRRLFRPPTTMVAQAVPVAVPDLRDEATQAAQLPADGWLALAREQLGRGEWRLAWRALQLATLARLAGDGLIALAKYKTNLDYERELRRRAVTRGGVVTWFAQRRGAFDAVWYGRETAAENVAREWLAELERPTLP